MNKIYFKIEDSFLIYLFRFLPILNYCCWLKTGNLLLLLFAIDIMLPIKIRCCFCHIRILNEQTKLSKIHANNTEKINKTNI